MKHKLYLKKLSKKDFLNAFLRIPLETTTLDLSWNKFSKRTGAELATAFAAIPPQVTTLNLLMNNLWKKTSAELADAFTAIPNQVTTLDLRANFLGKKTGTELETIFAAIPRQVTTLNLCSNYLSRRTGAELATAFAAIPPQVTTLNLTGNDLDKIPDAGLATAFVALPPQVTILDLTRNFLGEKTGTELETIFAAIPPQVTTLNLSRNNLYSKTRKELLQAFSSLPKTITTLDLSHDDLNQVSLSQMLNLLQALPQSITCIDLSHNQLFTKKSLHERDEFLQALGPLRENGRIKMAHNGESEGTRAVLPLKTLAQERALPDLIINHIFSFLSPGPESSINRQRGKVEAKLAQQRDVQLAQQKLLGCIKTLIGQDSFWKNKVRFPNQTTRKRPHGIQQIESLLKKLEEDSARCCQEIIARSNARHSKYWQWAHHFFRGRDNTTNTIYGILKKIVINDTQSIEATIKSLNELQTEHRLDVSANTSIRGN